MIEEMQWVRPEEIEARSMAIIESEMPAYRTAFPYILPCFLPLQSG